ncbi:MAG TPA: hypothetical protein VGD29_24205, partial [Actinoplanes sp.]
LVVGGGLALQTILTDPTQHLSGTDVLSLLLLGLILGPLTGYLGCRFAVMLRASSEPERAGTASPAVPAPVPAGAGAGPEPADSGTAEDNA